MKNRRQTNRPHGLHTLAALVLVVTCVACGTDGTPGDPGEPAPFEIPPVLDEPASDESARDETLPREVADAEPDTRIVLEADLRAWTERRITVDYTLRNDGDTERVALDASRALQIERLEDGRIRLFRGKQDTGDTDFATEPTIEGRALAPGQDIRGSGTRNVPLTLDYAVERAVDPATDTVEFCIAHGRADELVPTRRDDGAYSLNTDLALQRLACTTLTRASTSNTDVTSPLDDTRWERTLDRVLETLDGEARDVVLRAALVPRVPDAASAPVDGVEVTDAPDDFVLTDGAPGTRTRASCEGGGGFELVHTSGRASIEADDCVLDATRIDGRVVRTDTGRGILGERTSVTFADFTVDDGIRRVQVSSGSYDDEAGHPTSTATWSGLTYRLDEGGATRAVVDLELTDVSIFGAAFDRDLSASFTVAAPWTNDRPLGVTTPRSFGGLTTSRTGDFTQGRLVVETEDGERLTLEVDSGQPGSVLITLERGGTVTTHFRALPAALRQR